MATLLGAYLYKGYFMFLHQKLDERKWIKIKILELKNNALKFNTDQDNLLKQLLVLLDKLQTMNLIIHKVNNDSIIEISGTKLNLNTAIELRNTVKAKIDIISELIKANVEKLDVLALMAQRDNMLAEYSALDSAINQADWKIQID